jgi:hypothetical protein
MELLSPAGRASQLGFLLTILISATVEFFVHLALASSSQEFTPDEYYLITAVATAPFAWIQICAAIRRLADLAWPWGLALPLAPMCLWSLWALLGLEVSSVAALGLALLGLYAVVLLVILSIYRGASPAPPGVPRIARATETAVLPQPRPASVAGTTCPNGHLYIQAAGGGCPYCAAQVAPPTPLAVNPDQLVGWLVVIRGPGLGDDFILHSRTNRLGSDASMDVRLGDTKVSRMEHASVVYDSANSTHVLRPGAGPVALNGNTITGDRPLRINDRIKIGGTTLIFIPFAGHYHQWDGGNGPQVARTTGYDAPVAERGRQSQLAD